MTLRKVQKRKSGSILEPRIYTFEQTEPIIGKGKVANALLHEIAHVTVNANGDWIVNFDKHHFTCK